jgi:hypothetical protein
MEENVQLEGIAAIEGIAVTVAIAPGAIGLPAVAVSAAVG